MKAARIGTILSIVPAAALLSVVVLAQTAARPAGSDWLHTGQDAGGTKYSPLEQINSSNVAQLRRAWVFRTGDRAGRMNATPIVVDNVMYFDSIDAVYAVDADTGKLRWRFKGDGSPTRRGVTYWPGDGGDFTARLLTYYGRKIVALDVKTGKQVVDFGANGSVERDAQQGFASSPPATFKNLVITGGSGPTVDAYDVRTGRKVWTFNLIPQPGQPGHETWQSEDWKRNTGINVWGFVSVDVQNEMVFLPVSQASPNYWGGERPGDNLYGDSVVALDANTGKLKWYHQMVHHDIWDYDPSAQPALIDVVQNGQRIPAVAQHNKTGLLFIYNRLTGKPIFGVEERPVPQSTVPGEKTSPTQPFPVKPPPLAKNSFSAADLWDRTPGHALYCRTLWDQNKGYNDGPYTPWDTQESGRTAVIFPGAIGGGNWGGVSFNPDLGLIFANVGNYGQWGYLVKSAPSAYNAYDKTTPMGTSPGTYRFWNPDTSWPCQKGPWGELFAINANTGDIAWRVPLGQYPELEARGITDVGTPNLGGSMTTAGGLVFIAATVDSKFRAFDARTGKELWSFKLEVPGHSIPTTYLGRDGKQYVAVVAGGGPYPGVVPYGDYVSAFTLP
jgi:glucose dehydrogenase